MIKGAMRPLKLHDWSIAMKLGRKVEEARIRMAEESATLTETTTQNGEKAKARVKLTKEQRSERLASGLVKLARKCHVSYSSPPSWGNEYQADK